MVSKKNKTPLMMDKEPFVNASFRASVLKNESSQCFITSTPVAMNKAAPTKLKKMSMRLLIGVFKRYPKTKKKLFFNNLMINKTCNAWTRLFKHIRKIQIKMIRSLTIFDNKRLLIRAANIIHQVIFSKSIALTHNGNIWLIGVIRVINGQAQ